MLGVFNVNIERDIFQENFHYIHTHILYFFEIFYFTIMDHCACRFIRTVLRCICSKKIWHFLRSVWWLRISTKADSKVFDRSCIQRHHFVLYTVVFYASIIFYSLLFKRNWFNIFSFVEHGIFNIFYYLVVFQSNQ